MRGWVEGQPPPDDAVLVVVFDVLSRGRISQVIDFDTGCGGEVIHVTGSPWASSRTAVCINFLPVA